MAFLFSRLFLYGSANRAIGVTHPSDSCHESTPIFSGDWCAGGHSRSWVFRVSLRLGPNTKPVSDALLLHTIFMRRNTTTSHVLVSKNILQFEVYKCIFQKCCDPNITKRDHFASFLWTKTVMEPDRAIIPSLILESAHSIQTTFGVRLTAIFD